MQSIQCPAGDGCMKKLRGDVYLMWHPPKNNENKLANTNEKKEMKGTEEKENLNDVDEACIQLAIKKSLEPQRKQCQFCKTETGSIGDLQLHQANECKGIENEEDGEGHGTPKSESTNQQTAKQNNMNDTNNKYKYN